MCVCVYICIYIYIYIYTHTHTHTHTHTQYSKVIHMGVTRSHNLILYTGCRETSVETNTYIVEFVLGFRICLISNIDS